MSNSNIKYRIIEEVKSDGTRFIPQFRRFWWNTWKTLHHLNLGHSIVLSNNWRIELAQDNIMRAKEILKRKYDDAHPKITIHEVK